MLLFIIYFIGFTGIYYFCGRGYDNDGIGDHIMEIDDRSSLQFR